MQKWDSTDIRCHLFPFERLPQYFQNGVKRVLLAQRTPRWKGEGSCRYLKVEDIVFFPFVEWTLYPLFIGCLGVFFSLFFMAGIALHLSLPNPGQTTWYVLIGGLVVGVFLVARNAYLWLQMRKRRKHQKFGMYIFPTAVIFYYPRRRFFKDCRYFPRKGISEVIIDDYLEGGYDQPVKRRYCIQFYFSYLSLKRRSYFVFYDFPFEQGGRVAFEQLTEWLEQGDANLPALNRGKRV